MFDSMKKSAKGTLAAIVLGASTPAATAIPMVTLDNQVGNVFNYTLTNQSTAPLTQFTVQIGACCPGSASISAPGWSLLSTSPFDIDGDLIPDGQKLTFGAASPLGYFGIGDGTSYTVASTANQMLGQPVNLFFSPNGVLNENVSQPYFSSSAAAVPEPGSTAALAGLSALGVAAYMRHRRKKD